MCDDLFIYVYVTYAYMLNIIQYIVLYIIMHTCVLSQLQSCLTLCDPMDHSPPISSVHGILQARIQEWNAMPLSMGSFQPTSLVSPAFAGGFFTTSTTWEPIMYSQTHV